MVCDIKKEFNQLKTERHTRNTDKLVWQCELMLMSISQTGIKTKYLPRISVAFLSQTFPLYGNLAVTK